jgi:hypothetical protein
MEMSWEISVWRQFGAAIDMLDNALQACPDELWQARLFNESSVQPGFSEFWYITYHTLFWLVLFEGWWRIIPPVPQATPDPYTRGCAYVIIDRDGRSEMGTMRCP